MEFDLELLLVIGVFVTGIIWLLDRLLLAQTRRQHALESAHPSRQTIETMYDKPQPYREPWYVEYSKSFFPVLLIVLLLRAFVAEPFRIPSGSMIPTLQVGDFILVSKFAYDLRLPVVHTTLVNTGDPRRGDVIVFRYPKDPSQDYIKRVIGIPGDHIGYFDKVLYINGKRAPQQPLGQYNGPGNLGMNDPQLKRETLDGIKHKIILLPGRMSVEGEYTVPPHSYFVMGDNRDNSNDSRFWGVVPDKDLVGRAFLVWLNWNFQGAGFDPSRIGIWIK